MTARAMKSNMRDITSSVRAQAKVRIMVGLPVLLLGLAAMWHLVPPNGMYSIVTVTVMAGLHVIYMATALLIAGFIQQERSARYLAVGTAILDPLMLSGWLTAGDEVGALFVCFYLFTILGFGFRIGRKTMWICQIASLIGFAVVLTVVPSWHEHPIFGLSLFAVLVVVPIYATGLIKNLRDAQALAEFESQAKSQLLAKVSHELRTPLSGIVASAQLISAEASIDRVAKRADVILQLSNDLLLEINDLLDSAKFEAKALVLEPSLVDLNVVMEQIRLTFTSTAAAKQIGFAVTMDHGIQNMVQCDAHFLGRALKNLVGNAVKFTDHGRVEVRLNLLRSDHNSYRIRFCVQDTGIGIPLEQQKRIFEPFYQASSGTSRQYGGTGLGMSLAKEVVTLMGSEIIVQSEPGVGSLFYFDLDLPAVLKSPRESPTPAQVPPSLGKRVLIADDNATNLLLIQELLQRDQHIVTVAGNGEDALDLLNSQTFDVVFMDYNMGDMDGSEVLQIYRFGKPDGAPVFFLTADTTATTMAKLLDIGAAGVLYKPITSENLQRAIAQACQTNDLSVQPRPAPLEQKPALASLKFIPPKYLDLSVIEDLQTFSQRPEFFTQVLSSAAIDIERNSSGLLKFLVAGDIQKIHDTAHALGGLSDSVGAVRLAFLARKLMRIDRWELKTEAERWKHEIAEAAHATIACLRDLLPNQNVAH